MKKEGLSKSNKVCRSHLSAFKTSITYPCTSKNHDLSKVRNVQNSIKLAVKIVDEDE